jgi:hypothetical protein
MNTILMCFIIGVVAASIWARGVKVGVMLGLFFGLVRRSKSPEWFWVCSTVYGAAICGLLVVTILTWTGLRG